jgi:hypothetical protein
MVTNVEASLTLWSASSIDTQLFATPSIAPQIPCDMRYAFILKAQEEKSLGSNIGIGILARVCFAAFPLEEAESNTRVGVGGTDPEEEEEEEEEEEA